MRRALIFVAPMLAVVPGVASAAAGKVDCIETTLGPAAMARIGDALLTAADKGTTLAGSFDTDRDALIAARNECRRANAWSVDATDAAVSYAQARAGQIGAERALKADGVDVGSVAAAYAALSPADRRSFTNGISPAARSAIGALAKARGYLPPVKRHVVILFSALSGVEFYPAAFAAA